MKCHLAFALCGLLLGTVHAAESWWRVFGEIKPGVFAGGNIDGDKKPDKNLKNLLATTKFDEWARIIGGLWSI